MVYVFSPPTVDEAWPGSGRFFERYAVPRGVTVLKEAGVYRMVRYPSHEEVVAADAAYIGGHEYEVDAGEKAALEAAGYTVTAT